MKETIEIKKFVDFLEQKVNDIISEGLVAAQILEWDKEDWLATDVEDKKLKLLDDIRKQLNKASNIKGKLELADMIIKFINEEA